MAQIWRFCIVALVLPLGLVTGFDLSKNMVRRQFASKETTTKSIGDRMHHTSEKMEAVMTDVSTHITRRQRANKETITKSTSHGVNRASEDMQVALDSNARVVAFDTIGDNSDDNEAATAADNMAQQACKVNDHVQCPGSGAWCAGDQCCPGAAGTFTCPSASKLDVGCVLPKISDCTSEIVVFGGDARADKIIGGKVTLYRPDYVKFKRCTSATDCESCPSATDCHWKPVGSAVSPYGSYGELVFETLAIGNFRYVAEFWGTCGAGAKKWWVSAKQVPGDNQQSYYPWFSNAEIKLYLAEEAGDMIGELKVQMPIHYPGRSFWPSVYPLPGSTRVHVVIKAKQGHLPVKVKIHVELAGVTSVVAACMDAQMCLMELEQTDAGSELRNDNGKQLECLRNNVGGKCADWKQCLRKNMQEMNMLEAMLEAAVGSPALVESQPTLDSESSNENEGTCAHPSNDDPESWECECGADLKLACNARTDLAVCIKEKMCASNEICCSWKRERNCPQNCNDNMLIQATPTFAETLEGRRQSSGDNNLSEPLALLDSSVQGKACTKQNR